jgi:inhibitor of KinA
VSTPPTYPRILTAGDRGILIELGDAIDPALNARVRWLARAVTERLGASGLELVPTYRSLLVLHDPLRVAREPLLRRLEAILAEVPAEAEAGLPSRTVHLPACYVGAHGPDLGAVAEHNRIPPEEVVALHSGATYLVYMLGFTPGFPYLGGMSPRIATPRLETPRTRVEAGYVGIGGQQTGIYPVPSPGGWRLIARTPLRLFDPGAPAPFLLAAGDHVRFEPISPEEFADVSARVEAGTFTPRVEAA